MKPFDLEKAKKGAPVCTRSGKKARILAFDADTEEGYNIVALEENEDGFDEVVTVDNNGSFTHGKDEAQEDLFMAPVYGYMAVMKNEDVGFLYGTKIADSPNELKKYVTEGLKDAFCYSRVELFFDIEEKQKIENPEILQKIH